MKPWHTEADPLAAVRALEKIDGVGAALIVEGGVRLFLYPDADRLAVRMAARTIVTNEVALWLERSDDRHTIAVINAATARRARLAEVRRELLSVLKGRLMDLSFKTGELAPGMRRTCPPHAGDPCRFCGAVAITARAKYIDPDFRREPKTARFCCACGQDLKLGKPFRRVHLLDGGFFILHPDDEAAFAAGAEVVAEHNGVALENDTRPGERGDLGEALMGPDCAKRLGMEWSRPPETEA